MPDQGPYEVAGRALDARQVHHLEVPVPGALDERPRLDDIEILDVERQFRRAGVEHRRRQTRATEVGVHRHRAVARLGERRGEVRRHRGLAVTWSGRHDQRHPGRWSGVEATLHEAHDVADRAVRVGQRIVAARPHDDLIAFGRLDPGDRGAGTHPHDLLGLLLGADLVVEPAEDDGGDDPEGAADDHAHHRPGTARGRSAEAAIDLRNRLRTLQRGEGQLSSAVLECLVLLEGEPVGPRDGVALGDQNRVVRIGDEPHADVVELLLEVLDAHPRRLQALLINVVLTFGEVRVELFGERVGEFFGGLGRGLLGGEPERPGLEFELHVHLGREFGRIAGEVQALGHPCRNLTGGGQQLDLAGGHDRAVAALVGKHRMGGGEAGRLFLDPLGLRDRTDHRAEQRERDDEPPSSFDRCEVWILVHVLPPSPAGSG